MLFVAEEDRSEKRSPFQPETPQEFPGFRSALSRKLLSTALNARNPSIGTSVKPDFHRWFAIDVPG
jgi:hypothetical protein